MTEYSEHLTEFIWLVNSNAKFLVKIFKLYPNIGAMFFTDLEDLVCAAKNKSDNFKELVEIISQSKAGMVKSNHSSDVFSLSLSLYIHIWYHLITIFIENEPKPDEEKVESFKKEVQRLSDEIVKVYSSDVEAAAHIYCSLYLGLMTTEGHASGRVGENKTNIDE